MYRLALMESKKIKTKVDDSLITLRRQHQGSTCQRIYHKRKGGVLSIKIDKSLVAVRIHLD